MVHRSEGQLILDGLIFSNRNQEYGAFNIRRLYNSHLITAVVIGLIISTTFLLTPKIIDFFTPEEAVDERIAVTEVTLEQPPPLDANEPPPPPPPPVEVPKIATTKFLPPVIKKDEEVVNEEPPPKVEEIKGNTATITQEGAETNEIPIEAPPSTDVGSKTEEAVLWVAEKQTFKGGDLNKFLSKEIRYPTQAQNQGISGRVIVEFVIEKDGSVSNVKAVKGIGSGCDEEAVRVIKLTSGMWSPGKNNGHAVRLKMIQPIFFKVPDGN